MSRLHWRYDSWQSATTAGTRVQRLPTAGERGRVHGGIAMRKIAAVERAMLVQAAEGPVAVRWSPRC